MVYGIRLAGSKLDTFRHALGRCATGLGVGFYRYLPESRQADVDAV
jgi:hypothetical protein